MRLAAGGGWRRRRPTEAAAGGEKQAACRCVHADRARTGEAWELVLHLEGLKSGP